MDHARRRADDIHELARALPGVTRAGARGRSQPTVYQVSRRSFLFFRNPRPDAVDPDTGERYADVIVFWVESELEKGGHPGRCVPAVLHDAALRRSLLGAPSALRVGEMSRAELAGFVEGAWLSRAGPRAVARWAQERA